jgi:hypothetical protein
MPPPQQEDGGQYTGTEEQSNPDGHGSRSNLTCRASRFGVAVRFAAESSDSVNIPLAARDDRGGSGECHALLG